MTELHSADARVAAYLALLTPRAPGGYREQQAVERRRALGAVNAGLAGLPLDTPPETALHASVAARLRRVAATEDRSRLPLAHDRAGHLRLVTTPEMLPASMAPEPLLRNPFIRLLGLLRGRRLTLASRDPSVANGKKPARVPWQTQANLRRLLLLGLTLGQTVLAVYFMLAVLPYHGAHWLEFALLAVYAVLFSWVSAGFWTALLGFYVLLRGRERFAISASTGADAPIVAAARTAVLMPICNEDVARVYAGLRATYTSLHRADALQHFDFFVLSDTSHPDLRVAELEGWLSLSRELNAFGRLFYRRRLLRIKRKSGNIADWCRRWGSQYRYMVVLDADSVMSGACLKRLVQLMEANPTAGIIQTAPQAAGRETLYARIQQFANRVYGPLFTAGLHFWQLGESHYWGHNAILRVAPFMRHCALRRLPGGGAMGGEILSHDFVEAALMRRAGWAVWMAYDLPGSYEEMPPTLLDELWRDRRWCLGNLKNFRLFLAQGLHPAHRAVFMTGVMAYLSAPLWLLFLVLSTALLAVHTLVPPDYFPEQHQLFPVWPEWHPEWAVGLFAATFGLLLLPKLLALCHLALRPRHARLYGGPFKLMLSTLAEILFSSLLAPIRMLFHSRFVVTGLLGLDVGWRSPPRADAQTPWMQAIRRHAVDTVLVALWAALVYWLNPMFLGWLLPIITALLLAIPLSVFSSRASLGRTARAGRLFLIPEESVPARELRWTQAALRRSTVREDGFQRAVTEPFVNALLCAAGRTRERLPATTRAWRNQLVEQALHHGPGSLNEIQQNTLLGDPACLTRLHLEVWTAGQAHSGWGIAAG